MLLVKRILRGHTILKFTGVAVASLGGQERFWLFESRNWVSALNPEP